MIRFVLCALLLCWGAFAPAREVLIVVGLGGAEEYREAFEESIDHWETACAAAGVPLEVIGDLTRPAGDPSVKEALRKRLKAVGEGELWLILIGHGTFDGRAAKFNVAGEDFSSKELGEWCREISGDLVVVNTASASAPFVRELSGENRTVITATKSASEIYYARFGSFFAEAVTGLEEADIDNDEQVSLLECFLYGAKRVREFYEKEGRLATEHALLDDNGDGLATRAEWFEGTTATRVAKDGADPDGLRSMQQVLVPNDLERNFPPELRRRRDRLEREVRLLRRNRAETDEDEYYEKMESLLTELARIYREVEEMPQPEE